MEMKYKIPCKGLFAPLTRKLRFINAKPYFKGNSFLDIGSAIGEAVSYLPKDSYYLGIEYNKDYIRTARHFNAGKDFINFNVKHGIDELNIKNKFDTIIMLAIIEHLDNPKEVLINLKKYLNDDGRIVITTPSKFAGFILRIGCYFYLFAESMEEEHKQYFSKEKLTDLANETGYEIVKYNSFEFGLNNLIVIRNKRRLNNGND